MTTTSDPPPNEVSGSQAPEIDTQSLSASVRKGALWLAASNLLLRLANVSLTAIVARILSPRDFGVFAVASTVYVIVFAISELGLSSCLTRADLDIDSLAPTVVSISVLSSAVFAAAMAAFAHPIAVALGSAAAAGPIRVLSLALLFSGPFAVPYSLLSRDFRQDKLFVANALSFVSSTVLLIILAKSGSGAMAFAWSRVVGTIVMGCGLIALAPRQYRPGLRLSALSVIGRFGVPLAGANLVTWILLNVDYAFVGHLLGATELGVYVLAFNMASWSYSVLGAVINNTSVPAFSRVKDDHALLEKATTTALRAVSLISLPMCAMTAALARPFVLTLYGAKWAASADVLVILSLYGGIFIVCLVFANMFTSFGRTGFLFILQVIWIVTLVPAMALGVHRDGIIGAAYAHVAVIVPIVLPSYLLAVKRMTGIRLASLGKAVLPALLASAAAAVAARAAASQLNSPLGQLIVGLAAGGVTYFICAGRQVITVLIPGHAGERVLRVYDAAARLVGLPADGSAKHSAKYLAGEAPEGLKLVGPMHGNILADQSQQLGALGLADVNYRRDASMAQAVTAHKRDLIDRERLLGPDHPHTLAARANLAYAYRQVGWLAKAIPLYERTVADWRRLLGPDHPRTLRSSNYLASAYREVGRLAEAIALYEQTLAERRRLFGPGHPSTLRSNSYLAGAYRDAGRFTEAIALYKQTLAGWHQLLGADHPATLRASSYLASAYLKAGRLEEAIPLCEQTLASCIRVLGNNHALTGSVRRNLSVAHELTKSNSQTTS
jgi:lipopolysaccharide exporter